MIQEHPVIEYMYRVHHAIVSPKGTTDLFEAVKISKVWTASTRAKIIEYNIHNIQHPIIPETICQIYYRTEEGILVAWNNMYPALTAPCLCSTDQWKLIRAGRIPQTFITPDT